MSFIVKAPAEQFPTAPAGTFPAVCVDVIDLGMVENKYDPEADPKQKVRLVWQLDENDKEGKPFMVKADYTASLHEKATLRKTLAAWRGRDFTQVELFGFDVESVLGAGCLLSVVHNTGSRGGTFANVASVMKLARNMTAPTPRDYVRMKDRTPEPSQRPDRVAHEEEPPAYSHGITDDDIPF